MPRTRKAYGLAIKGSDCMELNIRYHPTAGKAKYDFITDLDWFEDMADAFKSVICRRMKMHDITLPDRDPECDELSPEQIRVIKHTYAVDHEKMGYRNYYSCSPDNKKLLDLVDRGIMTAPILGPFSKTCATFQLTEKGIGMAKSLAPDYPLYRH